MSLEDKMAKLIVEAAFVVFKIIFLFMALFFLYLGIRASVNHDFMKATFYLVWYIVCMPSGGSKA